MRALVGATSFAFDAEGNLVLDGNGGEVQLDRLALRTRVESTWSARRSDGRAPRRGNPWNGVRKVRAPQRRVAGNARPP